MQHFAQLSDPHLTTLESANGADLRNKRALGYLSWHRKRRFEHRPEVLAALQQDLENFACNQLLITGDLTHIGLPMEFRQAQAWLRQLGTPRDIAVVPGNHDACVSAPWSETFALWQDYMRSDDGRPPHSLAETFPSLRVRDGIAFIGVGTGVPKPPLMATGTAGAAQREKLAALLQQTREQDLFRVVYLHHCPLADKEKWRKRLTDAPQMQRLLEQHGAELVVHGHGHRRHHWQLDTRDGIAQVIAVPSASALGLHGADRAQYNRYSVADSANGWQLTIAAREFNPERDAFQSADDQVIELLRSREQPAS